MCIRFQDSWRCIWIIWCTPNIRSTGTKWILTVLDSSDKIIRWINNFEMSKNIQIFLTFNIQKTTSVRWDQEQKLCLHKFCVWLWTMCDKNKTLLTFNYTDDEDIPQRNFVEKIIKRIFTKRNTISKAASKLKREEENNDTNTNHIKAAPTHLDIYISNEHNENLQANFLHMFCLP